MRFEIALGCDGAFFFRFIGSVDAEMSRNLIANNLARGGKLGDGLPLDKEERESCLALDTDADLFLLGRAIINSYADAFLS